VAISAAGSHTCAVLASGALWCWGDDQYFQIGDGATESCADPIFEPCPGFCDDPSWPCIKRPHAVQGLNRSVLAVATGVYHTCVLLAGGAVKCWGWNVFGHHTVSYADSYRYVGFPAFLVVLIAALPVFGTLWLRAKLKR